MASLRPATGTGAPPCLRPDAEPQFVVGVETLIDPLEGAAGQHRENSARARHQRIAPRRAMTFERAAEQGGRPRSKPPIGARPPEARPPRCGAAAKLLRRQRPPPGPRVLPMAMRTFGIEIVFDPPELLVPARKLGEARGCGVRVEPRHLLREPGFLNAVGKLDAGEPGAGGAPLARPARSRSRASKAAGSAPSGRRAASEATRLGRRLLTRPGVLDWCAAPLRRGRRRRSAGSRPCAFRPGDP